MKKNAPVRRLEEIDDLEIKGSLSARLHDTSALSPRVLMEIIAWGYIEKEILSAWFPGVASEDLKTMSLDEEVRSGGKFPFVLCILLFRNASTLPHPKTGFSYQCSLTDVPVDLTARARLLRNQRKGHILARLYHRPSLPKSENTIATPNG